MYNLLYGTRVTCAVVLFIIVTGVFYSKVKTKEHSVLQIVLAFMYIYALDMVFQVTCETKEAALLVLQIREILIYCIMVMMFYFTTCYTGITPGKICGTILGIWSIVANIATVFFFRIDGWFLKNVEFVEEGVYPHLTYSRGIWGHIYEVLIVFYALLVLWLGIVYMGKESKTRSEWRRKQALMGAIILPEIFYTTYYFKLHQCYELIIIGFTVAAGVLLYASRRHRVFNVVEDTKDAMLDNLDEGMVIYNGNRKLLYANRLANQLLQEIDDFVQQNPKAEMPLLKGDFLKDGRAYEVHGSVIYHEDHPQGYSYYVIDVTEKRAQIKEALQARFEAEEASAAKSNFLASVSHEMRTPLNSIIGMSESGLRTDSKEEGRKQMKNILHSAKNLLIFINNLLDLSKMESDMLDLSTESYSLEQNVFEAMNIVNMSLGEKKISLEACIAENVPGRLMGDSLRVQHILLNLLMNAVSYAKEGKVTLKIYGEEKPEGYELHMDVSDTEERIVQERLGEIIWNYHQGEWNEKRERRSPGVGLTITKNLVEHMGGSIRVESVPEKGSTIYVSIIQQVDVWEKVDITLLTSQMLNEGFGEKYLDRQYQYTFEGAKVLVVDDTNTNLIVIQGLLEPYRMQLKCMVSAEDALEEISAHGEEYQLMLVDYTMFDKSGLEYINELGWELPNLSIVAMTADVFANMKRFFEKRGFKDYISKPVNRQKLEYILLRYLTDYKKGNNFYVQEQYSGELKGLEKSNIDIPAGLERNGHNIRNYCLVLATYEKEMKATLPVLKSMLGKDMEVLCERIHGIRDSSRSIGAEHAGMLAGKLEEELKQELVKHTYTEGQLRYDLERLEREVKRVINGISKFMQTDQAILYLSSGTVKNAKEAPRERTDV